MQVFIEGTENADQVFDPVDADGLFRHNSHSLLFKAVEG
jgi:hypothetical protein